jgi:2-polyprenyl-6-methoxyphenol hydroxylase-like FAD-dependent oxidoreductase
MESYGEYDVIVVGGGTSGVAAAISSARGGANTLLIERLGALGGQMNVSGPPGFAYAWMFNPRWEQVIAGFMEETHNRLLKEGHALPHLKPDFRAGYSFSYVDPDWWGLLMFEMMQENGVNLLLHSLAVDVLKEGKVVKGVVVENTSGRQTVFGKVTVDCTGEGDISVRAGAPYEKVPREQIQPHTLSFTVDGVNWDKVLKFIKENLNEFLFRPHPYLNWTQEQLHERIKQVKDITEIGEIMGWISLRDEAMAKGEWHGHSGVGFFLCPREGGVIQAHFQHSSHVGKCDPTDVRDLTNGEIEARRQIVIAWKFIKKYMPGFEKAYITRICPELRMRESRRIMGDYMLTSDDVVQARKFEDVIGKSSFPKGGHHTASTKTLTLDENHEYPRDGGSHDIPYRCLVPKNVENLLVAGKPISTDRDAYQRFLQQTMVTGQAAGAAAALCVKMGITPRELEKNVPKLQEILLKQGVILYGTH